MLSDFGEARHIKTLGSFQKSIYNRLKTWKSRKKSFARTYNSLTSFIQNLPWLICHLPPRVTEMVFTSSIFPCGALIFITLWACQLEREINLYSSCLIQPLQTSEGRNIYVYGDWPWQSGKEKTVISIPPFPPSCGIFLSSFTDTPCESVETFYSLEKKIVCFMGQR